MFSFARNINSSILIWLFLTYVLSGCGGGTADTASNNSVTAERRNGGDDNNNSDRNPGSQPPIANANGPYTGTVGAPVVFSSAGSFPYHCTVHPNMTASVTVQ